MPFRKNIERENTLLGHWREGHTVELTGRLTSIPVGTISHYFRRFNRDKEKYQKLLNGEHQEPPRSSSYDAASADFTLTTVSEYLIKAFRSGEFAKARDIAQGLLLSMDLYKRLESIKNNVDPKQKSEVNMLKNLIIAITSSKPSDSIKISDGVQKEVVEAVGTQHEDQTKYPEIKIGDFLDTLEKEGKL